MNQPRHIVKTLYIFRGCKPPPNLLTYFYGRKQLHAYRAYLDGLYSPIRPRINERHTLILRHQRAIIPLVSEYNPPCFRDISPILPHTTTTNFSLLSSSGQRLPHNTLYLIVHIPSGVAGTITLSKTSVAFTAGTASETTTFANLAFPF